MDLTLTLSLTLTLTLEYVIIFFIMIYVNLDQINFRRVFKNGIKAFWATRGRIVMQKSSFGPSIRLAERNSDQIRRRVLLKIETHICLEKRISGQIFAVR